MTLVNVCATCFRFCRAGIITSSLRIITSSLRIHPWCRAGQPHGTLSIILSHSSSKLLRNWNLDNGFQYTVYTIQNIWTSEAVALCPSDYTRISMFTSETKIITCPELHYIPKGTLEHLVVSARVCNTADKFHPDIFISYSMWHMMWWPWPWIGQGHCYIDSS